MFKRDENYKEFTYAIIFFITTIPIHSGMPSYARSLTRIFTKCYEICLHIKKSSFFFFLPFFHHPLSLRSTKRHISLTRKKSMHLFWNIQSMRHEHCASAKHCSVVSLPLIVQQSTWWIKRNLLHANITGKSGKSSCYGSGDVYELFYKSE